MDNDQILIVGGGPTGLTAALELGRHGVPCRVIERRAAPSPLSRAVGIMPNTMKLLGPSGAADAIRREAVAIAGVEIYVDGAPVFDMPMHHPDPEVGLFCLPQDRTEAILADAAAKFGVTVAYNTCLESLTVHEGHATCIIAGQSHDHRYVLGADGARSTVRAQVGLVAEGFDLEDEWAIADVEAPTLSPQGLFRVYIQEGGVVVIAVPMSPTRYRIVSTRPDALGTLTVKLPIEKVYREGNFRIGIRQVPRYREGPVFLAGDAAHQHSPVGGRGMNLGIADAAHFAACYVAGTLDRYSDDRHIVGADTIAFTERARGAITTPMNHLRKRLLQVLDLAALIPGVPARLTKQIVSGEF